MYQMGRVFDAGSTREPSDRRIARLAALHDGGRCKNRSKIDAATIRSSKISLRDAQAPATIGRYVWRIYKPADADHFAAGSRNLSLSVT